MPRQPINIEKLCLQPHYSFHHKSAVLTSGDYLKKDFNSMTIGWGAIGTMWSLPFAFVAVRHSRYTYQFMEKYDTFTVAFFPEQYHDALQILGTRSGRDGDKIAASGLNPETSTQILAPSFVEAELVLECRKMYANDLNPANFIYESIEERYPDKDYHCIYYGDIVAVTGVKKYQA
ncbi:MAG: flavin reductase family protein [Chloroflexi bacterium]|jgi:flavin reductase (DIM6/NTAB) family NADH-FMN oxidoreductase RutF|nr:flavin reductase family protein [Chloroflexota bacterium]